MRQIHARVVRHLTAADGYLDLGMPRQALAELEAVGDAGPLTPAVEFLTGQALIVQERYEEAIEPLRRAVATIPAPHNRDAWLSLAECFRRTTRDDLACVADMFADEPLVPEGWDDAWPENWAATGPSEDAVAGFAFQDDWRLTIGAEGVDG